MRYGASGYLLKNATQKTLLEAIRTIMEGEEYLDETIKADVAIPFGNQDIRLSQS
jgi:DNA-binding NarL/FixJ family response regulator